MYDLSFNEPQNDGILIWSEDMKNIDLLTAMEKETPVWFIDEKAELSADECKCGTICFLGIKKGKTQVGIEVVYGEGEMERQEFRAYADNVFASRDDLYAKIKSELTTIRADLDAKISKIK